MGGKNVRYHCPFCPALGKHNDDFALSVNWEKSVYHCFRCGTSGRTSSLPPNFKTPVILQEGEKSPREVLDIKNMTSLRDSFRGQEYLLMRKLDPKPLLDFVFVSGKQLVFPIYGWNGDIIYYISRKMWGAGRRYDNAPGQMEDIFVPYGCILPARWTLVVTEGIFDALSVWQWLGIECVALLGMNISSLKVKKILEYSHPHCRVIILLDAGEKLTAWDYYNELHPFRHKLSMVMLTKGDPNETGKRELWKKLMPLVSSDIENTSPDTRLKRNTSLLPRPEKYSKP